jgi:hypothetical protein
MTERELSVWDTAVKDAAIKRLKTIPEKHQGDPERGYTDALDVLGVLLTELGCGDVVSEFNHVTWELTKIGWTVQHD